MPLIQPITSPQPTRAAFQTHTQTHVQTAPLAHTTSDPSKNETGINAVAPAAPPSALQMQIQALISEQAQDVSKEAEQNRIRPV